MKKVTVTRKMLALAVFNTFLLVNTTNVEAKEIIPVEETKDINDYVVAKGNIGIKEMPTSTSRNIGVLNNGQALKLLCDAEGYYEVLFGGSTGYVDRKYVDVLENTNMIEGIYANKDTVIYDNEELTNELASTKKLDFFEAYDINNDSYLIKLDEETMGYIKKEDAETLGDTFVVVDISDQTASLYKDDQLIMVTPVLTGKHNATHTGAFAIYDISRNRYLVGPNYRSYVDYMMKFDGNIGLHDAEYHTDENGRKHGWRDYSEFGGDTYINNGSHGCVNMPHDAAETVYNNVTVGTKVLVKE